MCNKYVLTVIGKRHLKCSIHNLGKGVIILSTFLGVFTKLQKVTISFMSVCPSTWNNLALTAWIFMTFDITCV